MYEGAPNTPDEDRFWDIVERHKVTQFYTAPTAIRAFMKWGEEHPAKHDLEHPCRCSAPSASRSTPRPGWYHEHIGAGVCPDRRHLVADRDRRPHDHPAARRHAHQARLVPRSRSSGSTPPSSTSTATSCPTARTAARDPQALARDAPRHLRRPRALHRDLLVALPGASTSPATAPAATTTATSGSPGASTTSSTSPGTAWAPPRSRARWSRTTPWPRPPWSACPHEIKGTGIAAFVTLRNHVGNDIGAIAKPDFIRITGGLPKTRSGKIMRRLLRDVAAGVTEITQDTTTLEDRSVVDKLRDDQF
jgi:acetyl-CoA synthetase